MTAAGGIRIVGHRGAMGIEPENTLRSFRRAIEIGVDELELDVHLSADGELVVIHDDTVDRTTNGRGAVADLTAAQLRALDAGGGEPVPTLVDVLDACPDVGVQIEVKAAAAVDTLVALLAARPDARRCTVTSFRSDDVLRADLVGRTWRIGLLLGEDTVELPLEAARMDRVLVHRHATWWTSSRQPGSEVDLWPCPTSGDLDRARAWGAAGVTTDFPHLLVPLRHSP